MEKTHSSGASPWPFLQEPSKPDPSGRGLARSKENVQGHLR